MEQFKQEVKELSTRDLLLILEDQLDLYTEEEIEILKNELASRPENAIELEDEAEKRLEEAKEERAGQERLKRIQENNQREFEAKINKLRCNGYQGYYEYTTLSLVDSDGGGLPATQISAMLNQYALEGWHLVSAYSNELGHNSTSGGIGGFSTGTNSTIDQHILILERFIKI